LIGDIPLQEQNNPTLKKFIGIRNIVTDKKAWKRLTFYEIDGHDENKLSQVLSMFERMDISYICYQTLNGFHFVGLTPISATKEGLWHDKLQSRVPEYYAGNTLRVSLKANEGQKLIGYSLRYPYIERLANIYLHRFNVKQSDTPIYGDMPKYSSVFEKYWTTKI
jgi:hypothetical protein